MRLIFAGTPAFARHSLQGLLDAGHQIELVLTQPDRPSGRGKKLQPSEVKVLAETAGLALFQPKSLRDASQHPRLAQVNADAMIVAAYGLILPEAVLSIPRLGCINVHGSLLPRWRGAAPIQRAIEAGDTETGITIMQMDAGLDTGPMLLTRQLSIDPQETGGQLHDRMAVLGAQALTDALALLADDNLPASDQPDNGATYAHRLTREDATIDWHLNATELTNRVRAFDPVPGSTAMLGPDRLKIWQISAVPVPAPHTQPPGTVLQADGAGVTVACGSGQAVTLHVIQRAGSRRMEIAAYQQGQSLQAGQVLSGKQPDNAPD